MTPPLNLAFRGPVRTYQRHREAIENTLLAATLAWLVGLFLDGAGVLAYQWRLVLLLAIFALGAQSRAWGYYAAVAVLVWPLWALSPHLAALFLAVTLLGREWIIGALPWALLVAATPLLAGWQAVGLVPLLAGLVAGPTAGLWAGALAAGWLKVAAGLAGLVPELGALHGVTFTFEDIATRVAGTNSLQVLERIAAPFAESSFWLLLHVLQVAAWGVAGWVAGKLYRMDWRHEAPRLIAAPALAAAALILWAAVYLLPAWLEIQPLATFLINPFPTAGIALSALTAGLLAAFYARLQQPVALRRTRPRVRRQRTREGIVTVFEDAPPPHRSRPGTAPPDDDDVIMLELD